MKHSKVFAVAMKKGGVGKTTITLNTAEALALCGFKVLCIDNDEQHNLSNGLGVKINKIDIADLYNGYDPERFVKDGIYKTRVENLDCVPCSSKISTVKFEHYNTGLYNSYFDKFLNELKYDYVFIDCAPGSGLIQNEIALSVAEFYILPTLLKQFSLTGLKEIVTLLTGGFGYPMENIVIIPNNVDVSFQGNIKTNKHKGFIKALNQMYPNNVTDTLIPHDEILDDMIIEGKSIFLDRFKSSKAAKCFLQLILELFPIEEDEVYEKVMEKRGKNRSEIARKLFFRNRHSTGQGK